MLVCFLNDLEKVENEGQPLGGTIPKGLSSSVTNVFTSSTKSVVHTRPSSPSPTRLRLPGTQPATHLPYSFRTPCAKILAAGNIKFLASGLALNLAHLHCFFFHLVRRNIGRPIDGLHIQSHQGLRRKFGRILYVPPLTRDVTRAVSPCIVTSHWPASRYKGTQPL